MHLLWRRERFVRWVSRRWTWDHGFCAWLSLAEVLTQTKFCSKSGKTISLRHAQYIGFKKKIDIQIDIVMKVKVTEMQRRINEAITRPRSPLTRFQFHLEDFRVIPHRGSSDSPYKCNNPIGFVSYVRFDLRSCSRFTSGVLDLHLLPLPCIAGPSERGMFWDCVSRLRLQLKYRAVWAPLLRKFEFTEHSSWKSHKWHRSLHICLRRWRLWNGIELRLN